MSRKSEIYSSAILHLLMIGLTTAVTVEEGGIQPGNVSSLNDDSTKTCSAFESDRLRYTQIFEQANCTADHLSVTLVGQRMNCSQNLYVVGLRDDEVGKAQNKWKTCELVWQVNSAELGEWCVYDCRCHAGCGGLMVLRWPWSVPQTSWALCDISQHCNGLLNAEYFEGLCTNQSTCFVYGFGTWDEGIEFCRTIHPRGHMIEQHVLEEMQYHIAEAAAANYSTYWLGGRRPPGGGRFEFYWNSTGDSITNTNWRQSQPQEGTQNDDCITIMDIAVKYWDDASCSGRAMFMCQIAG